MKKFFTGLAIGIALLATPVGAVTIFNGQQGGTNIGTAVGGDVGKVLTVSSVSPLVWSLTSPGAGSQTPWAQNINGALYSLSNVGSLDATSSVITQATSTNIYTPNLKLGTLSGLLKAISGTVTTASAGTDYENPLTVVSPITRTLNALGFDFSTQNTWTGHNIFSSLFATNASSTNATTTTQNITSLSSALVSADAEGDLGEYAGTTCTNQFVRALSVLGVATCETVDISADTNLTAGDALTLTGDDIDFDGGTVPAGALGGTWASPTVDDDGHNHTGTTLSGIDISSDTNLSADGTEIILTGDALSLGTNLTFTNGTTTDFYVTGLSLGDVGVSGTGRLYSHASTTFSGGVTWTTGNVTNTMTAGDGITRNTDDLDCDTASSSIFGCLSSANWTTFNNKVATGSTITTGELPYWLSGGTLGSVATGTISATLPISVTAGRSVIGGALSVTIADAVADASTKGASTYTANDFNSASGNISLDYTNGQSASASNKGFLTTADWSTFNNKVSSTSLSGTAPITYSSATGVIACTSASAGVTGCLTGTDWSTFNSKAGFAYPWTTQSTWMATTSLLNISGGVMSMASSTFQILNVGSLTMPSKSDGCATFSSGALNSTGVACGSGGGGGYSLFSTSTINPLAIYMNAGDSLGLGTTTNRSALSMLALATTTGNHLTMRNGNTTWFQKVNDTGSWFMGTTSSTYATATHSALIVPTTGGLIVQGSGSSTLRNGITIEAGCFSVNGTCIGSGGTLTGSNASAGRVGFWSSANNIDGDADFMWDGALNKFFALKAAFLTSLEIATGTAPVLDRVGMIAFDTTDNQFIVGTSTTATDVAVFATKQKLWGATIASTSLEMVSGGRLWLPPQRDGFDIMEIHCAVDAGTSVVINISNSGGTTDSETVTCDADGQSDTSIGTNPSYAAGSLNSLELGTVTGNVDYLTFSVWGNIKRE